MIAEAKAAGYAVVFDRAELAALPAETRKVLGVFASAHTFNDVPGAGTSPESPPTYAEGAPTLAEMTAKALEMLAGSHFFAVIEEEGADNFGNLNNARGMLDGLKRADDAIGVALAFVGKHPDTLLLTAADSSAGNADAIGLAEGEIEAALIAAGRDPNGAPYGMDSDGKPFLAAPDARGLRHPFVIAWGTKLDSSGGIVARAAGAGASELSGSCDNTRIYTFLRDALFRKNEN